jgi:gluconokinase
MLTTEVENFPGFKEGILGLDLIDRMWKQAERFGAEFIFENATDVNLTNKPFKIFVGNKKYEGKSVIIATGASAKWLARALIIPGGSDGALSNIGLGAVEKGIAALNIGTSGAVRVLSDKPFIDANHKSQFFCYYAALGNWLSGGAISNAGNILRWYKDKFGQDEIHEAKKRGIDSYEVIMENAADIKPGAEGLFLLPFYVGERFPIRNSKAKGILFGLTLTHGKAHVVRAILEGIVYTLKWILEILEKHRITIEEVRAGGGGARSKVWRQIQADVLGKPVVHTRVEEASSLGAAMLAAIKLNIYKDLNDASKNMVKTTSYHKPNIENNLKYLATFKLFKELYGVSKKFYE